ncbi:hypothetical protein HDU92_009056 [Lobulomyces angularis]|nr:hypothetical protein HDU92_009056 [Lobulomyces angularis]
MNHEGSDNIKRRSHSLDPENGLTRKLSDFQLGTAYLKFKFRNIFNKTEEAQYNTVTWKQLNSKPVSENWIASPPDLKQIPPLSEITVEEFIPVKKLVHENERSSNSFPIYETEVLLQKEENSFQPSFQPVLDSQCIPSASQVAGNIEISSNPAPDNSVLNYPFAEEQHDIPFPKKNLNSEIDIVSETLKRFNTHNNPEPNDNTSLMHEELENSNFKSILKHLSVFEEVQISPESLRRLELKKNLKLRKKLRFNEVTDIFETYSNFEYPRLSMPEKSFDTSDKEELQDLLEEEKEEKLTKYDSFKVKNVNSFTYDFSDSSAKKEKVGLISTWKNIFSRKKFLN